MSDITNSQVAGGYALLVEFLWGASGSARYTNWTDEVTIGDDTFTAVVDGGPNIETRIAVTLTAQTGKVPDEPWQILMPPVLPLTKLARMSAWPQVTCNIYETDPTAETPVATLLWSGIVTAVTINPKEAPAMLKVEVSGLRCNIAYPLGVESKTACSRRFGDTLCGVDLSAIRQTAEITAISAHRISAPSLTIPGGKPDNYWSFGYVTFDGLSISIIDGSAGVSSLRTLQVCPPEWVGVTATFTPGCDKSLKTCDVVWDNADRFFGIGVRKPADSPFMGPR